MSPSSRPALTPISYDRPGTRRQSQKSPARLPRGAASWSACSNSPPSATATSCRCSNATTCSPPNCSAPAIRRISDWKNPCRSVDQAVLILGHQQILHIVLTLAFGSAMVVPLPGYAVEANELWRHSLITATAGEIDRQRIAGIERRDAGGLHRRPAARHRQTGVEPGADAGIARRHPRAASNRTAPRAPRRKKRCSAPITPKSAPACCKTGICRRKSSRPSPTIISPCCDPRPRLSVVAHLANCLAHVAGSAPGWDGYRRARGRPRRQDAWTLTRNGWKGWSSPSANPSSAWTNS